MRSSKKLSFGRLFAIRRKRKFFSNIFDKVLGINIVQHTFFLYYNRGSALMLFMSNSLEVNNIWIHAYNLFGSSLILCISNSLEVKKISYINFLSKLDLYYVRGTSLIRFIAEL